MVRAIRFGFCVVLSFLAASPVLAKDEVEAFCTMELVPAMKVAMAAAKQQRKDSLLRSFRDEVLAQFPAVKGAKPDTVLQAAASMPREEYQSFLRDYFEALEKKVQWSDGKRVLVALMHEVIAAQPGSYTTKSDLFTRVDETSIVSFSEFLPLLEKMNDREFDAQKHVLANSCGGDGLAPGGIAFRQGEKKVFAFCPGAILRASVTSTAEGMAWSGTVDIDALLFTAF